MKTVNRFLIRLRNLVTGRRGDQRLREELEDGSGANSENCASGCGMKVGEIVFLRSF